MSSANVENAKLESQDYQLWIHDLASDQSFAGKIAQTTVCESKIIECSHSNGLRPVSWTTVVYVNDKVLRSNELDESQPYTQQLSMLQPVLSPRSLSMLLR